MRRDREKRSVFRAFSLEQMFGAILTEVYQHEAVAEANVNFESDGSATFDLTFYTDYCPNISDETKAG